MNKFPFTYLIFLIFQLVLSSASHAVLDDIQIGLSQPYEFPLRWDNVKEAPVFFKGKAPELNPDWGLHQVTLTTNEFVTIWLAEGQWLRIYHPNKAFSSDAFDISVSYGTGLYAYMPIYTAEQGKSLLLAPDLSHSRFVRIRLNSQQPEAMALLTSRHENLYDVTPQYFEIPLLTESVKLEFGFQTEEQLIEETFWSLQANSPVNLTVTGPARLGLESRFIYPPTEAVLQQAYRLFVRLDDEQVQVFDFETTAENQQSISISGNRQVLGRSEMTYLNIPDGQHQLQVHSSANLFTRIVQYLEQSYLLAEMNKSQFNLRTDEATAWLNQSVWQLTEADISTLKLTHFDTLATIKQHALRLIRDNSHREGGLLGAMTMREAARRRPYEARVRNFADNLLGRYSSYRNLLPQQKPLNQSLTFHRFINYNLHDPSPLKQPLVVAEQHKEAYLKRVAGAYFVPLQKYHNIYQLPKRTAPSLLRVIVKQQAKPQIQTFWLQFDNQQPVRMQVEPYVFSAPSHYYRYAQGEAGLKMLALAHNTDADTLGGPFTSRHLRGSLVDAATFVLPLPPEVQQVKLWQSEIGTESLRIALQFRVSRLYRLTETEYLEMVSHFSSPEALFDYFFKVLRQEKQNIPYSSSRSKTAKRELYNHWLPLIRFLQAQKKRFLATIYRPEQEKYLTRPLALAELNALVEQAHQAELNQQWLVALEKWTQIARGSREALHRQAQLARADMLEQLGEAFLATRLLQGFFLDSTNPILAQKAYDKLLYHYQNQEDKLALLPLLATAVLRQPTKILLTKLIQALIDNGYQNEAFMLGMVMPPTQRPHALLIEQAYHASWWETFAELIWHLPEKQQQLWFGFKAQDQGNYAAAFNFWQNAGADGLKWAKALKKGLQIRAQLQTPSNHDNQEFKRQKQAISDWAQWQTDHPGPRHWKNADQFVHDYAQSELIYNLERNRYFNVFISTPKRPVKLHINGPQRIRLSVRTLHHNTELLNNWIKIKETRFFQSTGSIKKIPKLHVLRLNNVLPTQGLQIVGQPNQQLGHQTVEEYEFGPGLHEVEIFSNELSVAVKVTAEVPRLPLAALPPLNKDSLAVALMLQDAHFTGNTDSCQFVPSSYPERGESTTQSIEPQLGKRDHFSMMNQWANRCHRATYLPDCQCTDCVLFIPYCMAFTSYNQYLRRDTVFITELMRYWQAMGEIETSTRALNLAGTKLNLAGTKFHEAQIAEYLATGNLAAVLESIEISSMDLTGTKFSHSHDVLKKMTLLLWIAEQSPALAQQAVVAGAALFHRYPNVAKLRQLWLALQSHHHWQNVQSVESSAGIHLIKVQGWQPESPSQRIRKTLLKPITESEQMITGHRQMGLSMLNLADTTLEFSLKMDDVAYFQPVPMNVLYWLDEQPPRRHRLTHKKSSKIIQLAVPKGEHVLYVAIDEPVANQFLRIQVREIGRDNTLLFWEYERTYHLVTPEEPLIVNVQGPNWLRIDEWESEEIYSRFQKIEPGWHQLTFAPRQDQESAFLRVHEFVPKTEELQGVQFRYVTVASHALPPPIVQIHKLPPVESLGIKDAFSLGHHGTWSFTSLLQRRKNVEEDETDFQDFLELRATYRYFDDMKNRHYRTEWLTRSNDSLDLTLGARQVIRYRPQQYDFTVQLSGSAYMQQLWNNRIEGHGLLKGSLFQYHRLTDKTYHVPSVGLFGRLLTLNETPRDIAMRLDNDVYSNYKADHRFGVRLTEKISHSPWLDTLWTGRISLTSNENLLKPDYLSFTPVWKQMLGDGQVDVGYRFLHYWADDDRQNSNNRHSLSLNLSWDKFHNDQTRWEWGFKLRQDLNANDLLGMIYLTWHDSKGHAYRDFMSSEIDFFKLKRRRVPQTENNEIIRLPFDW